MPLNYQFYNNTSQEVRDEIKRRESLYWPNGEISNEALSWNYQKTAYLILKALKIDYTPAYNPSSATLANAAAAATNTSTLAQAFGVAPFSGNTGGSVQSIKPTPASTKITSNPDAPIKRIKSPTAPILELYGPDYTNSNGTLKGAVLNSAEINVEGTYGSILNITANFTVFDKDELDNYMNSFLRPGVEIGLEFGWTVNDNIAVNKTDIHGTVFNFSFSAKEDGSWDCTLHAYGPSLMTYGFNVDAKDAETKPDPSNYATYGLLEIFRTVIDNESLLYDSEFTEIVTGAESNKCKKVYASQIAEGLLSTVVYRNVRAQLSNDLKKEGPVIYIFQLPAEYMKGSSTTSYDPYGGSSTTNTTSKVLETLPQAYITLNNLIELINQKINKISKRGLPNYSFTSAGVDICVGTNLNEIFLQTGPADSSKFAFTTQRNGTPGPGGDQSTLSLRGSSEPFASQLKPNAYKNIPLQHLVLINVKFIVDEFNKIISGDKNVQNKKIISFLKLLFSQLETETGGIIDLVLMPERDRDGNISSILIQNKNGTPDGTLDDINVFTIPMMTKGSVVRAMNIESKVPDAVITEVATFTRAGLRYGGESQVSVEESNQISNELISSLSTLNETYLINFSSTDQQNASSINQWRDDVRNIYRKLSSIRSSLTLNSNGTTQSINNILDLKTAVFPIYLKLTLDGINGFLYGNAIKTNWLPVQYRDSRIYWTVTKIRHVIQNNDWTTELEAIYRVKER